MAKPRKSPTVDDPDRSQVIWCRMPIALVRKIDRRVEREQRDRPHTPISRSSVLRSLVHEAFAAAKGDA